MSFVVQIQPKPFSVRWALLCFRFSQKPFSVSFLHLKKSQEKVITRVLFCFRFSQNPFSVSFLHSAKTLLCEFSSFEEKPRKGYHMSFVVVQIQPKSLSVSFLQSAGFKIMLNRCDGNNIVQIYFYHSNFSSYSHILVYDISKKHE